jgi:RNA polymerase sigma-70 factor (ECF subfamily)
MLDAAAAIRLGGHLDDDALLARVLAGEIEYFEVLMRRHNPRVFRAARAIVRDDAMAEEIMQETYVRAYVQLASFEGRSAFSTWLTRIALNEAIACKRKRQRENAFDDDAVGESTLSFGVEDPEVAAHRDEVRKLLERAVDALPESLRTVFVLRDVQELSVAETADCLGISEENVRVRLHRAHAELKRLITAQFDGVVTELFGFYLDRCDRVILGVLQRVASTPPEMPPPLVSTAT